MSHSEKKYALVNIKKEHPFGTTIPNKEIKELRRVYEKLCNLSEKIPKLERLKVVKSKLNDLRRPLMSMETGSSKSGLMTANKTNFISVDPSKTKEFEKLEEEVIRLNNELSDINAKSDQYIRPQDAAVAMKSLGKRISKREACDMIWEIDEKTDGFVDWEEFQLMFERNIRDTSGLEPSTFYRIVQFMIYDRDGNGLVSIDETMNMLYARLGRAKMETTITKLFGGDDGAPIKEVGSQGGEINFDRFCSVHEKEQLKTFSESDLGRALADKKRKKRDVECSAKIKK